jgi:hypothetical protein
MAGGYFVASTGLGAIVMLGALLLRIVLAERPFAGLDRGIVLAVAALAGLAIWILVSAYSSGSAARALVEFDRALLYLAALTLYGMLPRSDRLTAWSLRALTAAVVAVCAAGTVTRVLPDLWSVPLDIAAERLSYPLTYWNALGLMAAFGLVLSLHAACSEREPRWMRVSGAAASPLVATCLYLTLSRGGIAMAVIGVVVYLVVARPWGAVAGLLATVPATAFAVASAYGADLLTTDRPTSAAAVAQGHDLAMVLGLCMAAAALLRLALLPLDARLGSIRLGRRTRLRAAALAALATASVLVAAAAAFDLPAKIGDQYESFTDRTAIEVGNDPRTRLTDPGNNGRIDQWEVALDTFRDEPLTGTGAGTYAIAWERERPIAVDVEDGHSLYLETLAELGAVGLALLLLALGAVLVGFALQARSPHRHMYAALLTLALIWALHAGIDWDWEMPAITLWLWAFGGMALAAPAASPSEGATIAAPRRFTRTLLAVGCLLLAIAPALMALSQRHLDAGVEAFERGDCAVAIDSALDSLAVMSVRPQPFELLGYCDSRLGLDGLAERSFESAIERDGDNWELHYGLALVRAAARKDPRSAARTAHRLNPRETLARRALRMFDTSDPQKWKRRALRARLPIG